MYCLCSSKILKISIPYPSPTLSVSEAVSEAVGLLSERVFSDYYNCAAASFLTLLFGNLRPPTTVEAPL